MANLARSSIIIGPAKGVFNSATFFHNGNVSLKKVQETFRIQPGGFSQADVRVKDRQIQFDATPDGRWNAAHISALFPHFNAVPGKSMLTGTDLPFVWHDSNAHLHTIKAVACVKPPTLILRADQSALGPASFVGLIPDGVDPDDADAYEAYVTSTGTFADSSFTLAALKTQVYTGALSGVTGLTSFISETGFTVETTYETAPYYIPGIGTVDIRLKNVRVVVKFTPPAATRAQIMTALGFDGSGNALGASRSSGGAAFTITGADAVVWVTIPKLTLITDEVRYSAEQHRNGELMAEACLSPSTGAQAAICTLAAS
jgi:hypothetical protein